MPDSLPRLLKQAHQLVLRPGVAAEAGRTLETLPAEVRSLLLDGGGSAEGARDQLAQHFAEAVVAERLLVALGGEAYLPGLGREDPAGRLSSSFQAALPTAEVEHLLHGVSLEEAGRAELFPASFPGRATKRRGGVYTNPELVELLLDLVDWQGEGLLLEPAVGDGAFLLPAWRRLRARRGGGALRAVDVHPYAARAARTALALEALAEGIAPELVPSLVRADALGDDSLAPTSLCDEYDVVVGNPPYVRGERIPPVQRARYRERFPQLGQGNVDLAAYFVRRAFEWLKPGGRMAFVLTQGLAEARSTAGLRAFLAEQRVLSVVSLEWAQGLFPGAAVIPCLLVVEKSAPSQRHSVRLATASPGPFSRASLRWTELRQQTWLQLGRGGRWPLCLQRGDAAVLQRLNRAPRPLSAGYGLALRTRTNARSLIGDRLQAATFRCPRPLLDGREVRAWSIDGGERWIDYQPELISDPKSEEFFRAPKVLVPRISLTPQAAVDDDVADPYFARNTVMIVRAPGTVLEQQPHALAALINSLPVRVYAFLVLRAGVLAGSHRATFYAKLIGDLPVPGPLLKDVEAVSRLSELGREARRLAQEKSYAKLRELQEQIDERVAGLFRLSEREEAHLRRRAAEKPLCSVLLPVRAGEPTRKIGVQEYAAGVRYR